MPTKPKKLCAVPGCPNVVDAGKTYCPEHERQRQKQVNANRESTSKRYDRHWQRLRRLVLNNEPLCRECKKHGRLTLATEVDHIIPLSKGGTNDCRNLVLLCPTCHNKIHNPSPKDVEYWQTWRELALKVNLEIDCMIRE